MFLCLVDVSHRWRGFFLKVRGLVLLDKRKLLPCKLPFRLQQLFPGSLVVRGCCKLELLGRAILGYIKLVFDKRQQKSSNAQNSVCIEERGKAINQNLITLF